MASDFAMTYKDNGQGATGCSMPNSADLRAWEVENLRKDEERADAEIMGRREDREDLLEKGRVRR